MRVPRDISGLNEVLGFCCDGQVRSPSPAARWLIIYLGLTYYAAATKKAAIIIFTAVRRESVTSSRKVPVAANSRGKQHPRWPRSLC